MKSLIKKDFTEKPKFEDFNDQHTNLWDFKHTLLGTDKFLLRTKKLQKNIHNNVFNIHMY